MRTIAIDEFNTTPTLHEMPMPTPGPGEVRVRIAASSVNGFELFAQSGSIQGVLQYRFPIVLGKDFAGRVDAVGPEVDGFAVGDDVFGVVTKPLLTDGAWSEYVTVPTSIGIAKRPRGLPVEIAGVIGVAGATADQMLDELAVSAGQTVLIPGAAGGVGSIAVPLAVARGARVIAIAKRADFDYVRGLGAAIVVDPESLPDSVRRHAPDGVDAVVHVAGDAQMLASLIKPGGRFSSALGADPEQFKALPITATRMWVLPTPERLAHLGRVIASGAVNVKIHRTYSFVDAAQAIADFKKGGKVGKIAIAVGDRPLGGC
jgi:NADPH2:quinone reductase